QTVLVVRYQKNASTRFELFDTLGKPIRQIMLPGIGTAGISTDEERSEVFLSYTSFNQPPIIYRIELEKGRDQRMEWEKSDVKFEPSAVEAKQVCYPSKDGRRVSMFIVDRKGMELDGYVATWLMG